MKTLPVARARFESWAGKASLELDRDVDLLCYNSEVTHLAYQAWCAARRPTGQFEAWARSVHLPLDRSRQGYASFETRNACSAWHAAQERALAA